MAGIGVIKTGASADIIAFDGDLKKNCKELIYDKVSFIMQAGKIVKTNN